MKNMYNHVHFLKAGSTGSAFYNFCRVPKMAKFAPISKMNEFLCETQIKKKLLKISNVKI